MQEGTKNSEGFAGFEYNGFFPLQHQKTTKDY